VFVDVNKHGKDKVQEGFWETLHLVHVKPGEANHVTYTLKTSMRLSMDTEFGTFAATTVRQFSTDNVKLEPSTSHIVNMGNIIQKMENGMRDELLYVMFEKLRQVCTFHRPLSVLKLQEQVQIKDLELAKSKLKIKFRQKHVNAPVNTPPTVFTTTNDLMSPVRGDNQSFKDEEAVCSGSATSEGKNQTQATTTSVLQKDATKAEAKTQQQPKKEDNK